MNLRNCVVASLLAAVAASASMTAVARTNVELNIGIGPPPLIVEEVPPPRVGYAWAPGYWGWNGHKHVWHNGYWMHGRPGYVWAPHRWEQRGDRWYFSGGRWERHS
jgi:hypothetical protein